jgi:hypothetical protein
MRWALEYEMDFSKQIVLLLIDKLGVGLLILFAGFLLNRILKRGELKIVLENELEKLRQSFANDLGKLGKSKTLEYAERQLSEFYWPLYVRWFTLDSLRSMRRKYDSAKDQNVRGIAEQEVIIQSEMVAVIHRGIHLMEDNNSLFEALRKLCTYSASFRAELETVCIKGEPEHLSKLWPSELRKYLVSESFRLQKQFDNTVKSLSV